MKKKIDFGLQKLIFQNSSNFVYMFPILFLQLKPFDSNPQTVSRHLMSFLRKLNICWKIIRAEPDMRWKIDFGRIYFPSCTICNYFLSLDAFMASLEQDIKKKKPRKRERKDGRKVMKFRERLGMDKESAFVKEDQFNTRSMYDFNFLRT